MKLALIMSKIVARFVDESSSFLIFLAKLSTILMSLKKSTQIALLHLNSHETSFY